MRKDRPVWVWIISIVLGLMATSQILILSSILLWDGSLGVQRTSIALTAFDWFSLYVLAVILLTSMISLFRLRKRSVDWFIVYIGLASFGLVRYAATPESEPHFEELVSLGGLLIAFAVLGYMLRLKNSSRLA